jgi:hypothetical protein
MSTSKPLTEKEESAALAERGYGQPKIAEFIRQAKPI